MSNIKWKNIIGYKGLYQINNFGNVVSLSKKRGNGRGWNTKKQIKNLNTDKYGYLTVNLSKKSKKKTFRVARLVAIHFIKNPDNKPQVNHKDGDKKNNFYKNLEWVTSSENNLHAFQVLKRKHPRGMLGKTYKKK